MKIRFIFNPCSGRNQRRPGFADAIREFVRHEELDAELTITERPGHATELAREAVAAGMQRIVAVGGDGTMNEVAQGVVGTSAALALVPCGSGNGLALHLGVPRVPLAALRLAAGREDRVATIDTGVVNGRPFFNTMGLGLDAEISRRFSRITRRGFAAYTRLGWQAIKKARPERVSIFASGGRVALEVLLVAVGNSDQYGNNARIAPRARVDDGALDLVAIKPVGWFDAGVLAGRLFLGNIDRSRHVLALREASFTIERAGPGLIHTDGEPHSAPARLDVAVRRRSLRIVIPAHSRAVAPATDCARKLALALS